MEIRDNAIHRAFGDAKPPGSAGRMAWRLSSTCTSPVHLIKEKQVDLELQVRCRHCPGCLRSRRHLWSLRAQEETLGARTWFFTGTWADQHDDLDRWNEECTLWLKRVRKRCTTKGVSVRYLLVPELHKSGMLHMHCLVHEKPLPGSMEHITWRDLARSWPHGHIVAKICDHQTASYITKYTTKDLSDSSRSTRPRIRASRRYGPNVMQTDPEQLAEILKARPEPDNLAIWNQNLQQILREHPQRKRQ